MIECVVTSSVLILVLIGLRLLFRGKIGARLQYALWGLVLLRLLLPFSLFRSPFSVMNAVEPTRAAAFGEAGSGITENISLGPDVTGSKTDGPAEIREFLAESRDKTPTTGATVDAKGAEFVKVVRVVWPIGSVAVGLWIFGANLLFFIKLRRSRRTYDAAGCPLPVYLAENLSSPCLFGLVRPSVYLTPKAIESETGLRHVLTHELCHFRQGDHLWSVLRGICLASWWWNPLVWVAAVLSRQDSEIACDEAAIRQIGGENRLDYGRTLVGMIAIKRAPADLFCAATTMASGAQGIKARLNMIVKNPKTALPALAAVLLIVAMSVGCTFTGAKENAALSAEEALIRLMASAYHQNGEVSFEIPESYEKPGDWNIHIAGRLEAEGFSQSVHYMDDITASKEWVPGKRYSIPLNDGYTELTLTAFLPDGKGGTLEKSVDLLKTPTYTASYQLTRFGAAGKEVSSVSPLTEGDAQLAEDIIQNYMLKSSAWQGIDLGTLNEYYLIRAAYPDGSVTDYYAFELDGKAVLQAGTDGRYTRIDDALYERLTRLPEQTSSFPGAEAIEPLSWDYIEKETERFEAQGVSIVNSRLDKLERVGRFDKMTSFPIEIWRMEYRLLPDDIRKVVFAGGMQEEGGWINEYASMGQPCLIVSYETGKASLLGYIWTGNFAEEGGMESALRLWLESSGILPKETYPGNHVIGAFVLSDGTRAELLLSQPVRQGEGGIWCVERWTDEHGNLYLATPNPKGMAMDTYEALQKDCDSGLRQDLLDPNEVAFVFATEVLGQKTARDEITITRKPAN